MVNNLEQLLYEKYGFTSFKPGQEETIKAALAGENTLAVLPTGTGKSLIYQFTSDCLAGQTIIVSPLISLMEDQVNQLRQLGEKSVVAINSQLSFFEKNFVLSHISDYKYIFLSPETLVQETVIQHLKTCHISLFVVDEAHCISQWGNDFRPDYLHLYHIIQELQEPLVMGLTATATETVLEDISKQLFKHRPYKLIQLSVDRPNIYYSVISVEDKLDYLTNFLSTHDAPGIIYFSSKKEAEKIAAALNQVCPFQVAAYHGGMSPHDRINLQQQFINDDIRVLCATNAFGMGINKTNIRFVIHYHLPDSLENYTQEVGRAGRDGKQSVAILLYNAGDERLHLFLQDETYHQKADLLFLKNKTDSELEQYLPQLNDLQVKWYNQLKKNNWDWETFDAYLALKKHQQSYRLYDILQFITGQTCRRKSLLTYFNQVDKYDIIIPCCDICQAKMPTINYHQPIKEDQGLTNSKEILKKLFLL
ncbi:RecQ family ATP-dependent DNA helicase [Vagococcus penaei]|uniref:ATP-dependent DNA helicase RecQ n=1 Tax=Vagococcus penaei TaxID=633807 RepID=A0A1Q2D3M1_9ENTE|nr:ATP-dependent DNA helicase RecQ [Vagococcus penaei]AQP52966.1 hypothetical protein BW732_01165 [Vagococcus penaei]RSU02574.1 RecQ family ATP-dependent DNA helicase [Vagococcus penaei]